MKKNDEDKNEFELSDLQQQTIVQSYTTDFEEIFGDFLTDPQLGGVAKSSGVMLWIALLLRELYKIGGEGFSEMLGEIMNQIDPSLNFVIKEFDGTTPSQS